MLQPLDFKMSMLGRLTIRSSSKDLYVAGAYSRYVAHPTFKTLFLSSEESEELAVGFFEKNQSYEEHGRRLFQRPFEIVHSGMPAGESLSPNYNAWR